MIEDTNLREISIDDFLSDVIDNNLINDMNTIKKYTDILRKVGDRRGLIAYPILSSVISGIELLGMLTAPDDYIRINRVGNESKEKWYFIYFWIEYLKTANRIPYLQSEAELVWRDIRNGIAHKYMIKSLIVTYRFHEDQHLTYKNIENEKTLVLSANQLFEDFVTAYNIYKNKLWGDDNLYQIGAPRLRKLIINNPRYVMSESGLPIIS